MLLIIRGQPFLGPFPKRSRDGPDLTKECIAERKTLMVKTGDEGDGRMKLKRLNVRDLDLYAMRVSTQVRHELKKFK